MSGVKGWLKSATKQVWGKRRGKHLQAAKILRQTAGVLGWAGCGREEGTVTCCNALDLRGVAFFSCKRCCKRSDGERGAGLPPCERWP